jgi:hypothetical protein
MKLFVWMLGQNGELLDSHLFFFDRYSDLADYHRLKGRTAKAGRLAAIAEAHYQAAPGDDEPPKAAAMSMPAPRPPLNTNAVSTTRVTELPIARVLQRGRRKGKAVAVRVVCVVGFGDRTTLRPERAADTTSDDEAFAPRCGARIRNARCEAPGGPVTPRRSVHGGDPGDATTTPR